MDDIGEQGCSAIKRPVADRSWGVAVTWKIVGDHVVAAVQRLDLTISKCEVQPHRMD